MNYVRSFKFIWLSTETAFSIHVHPHSSQNLIRISPKLYS